MTEPIERRWLSYLLWILGTLLFWPVWLWVVQRVVTYPITWVASLLPEQAPGPGSVGGLYGLGQAVVLAVAGLVFGFLGVYLLRRFGAPQIVWVPAAIVSLLSYLAVAALWASFSGYGTGWANITESVAISVGVGLTMAIGAWLGAREWHRTPRSRERRFREHTAEEFGQSPAAGGMVGFDPPMYGAASVIALDGVVERESGATPPPPPFSLKTAGIALGVMLALAGVLVVLAQCFAPGVGGP